MKNFLPLSVLIFIPISTYALTFAELATNIYDGFLITIINILIALAVVYFAWGVFSFIMATAGGGDMMEKAKDRIFWGVIALFIMMSVWGLVSILDKTLDLDNRPAQIIKA